MRDVFEGKEAFLLYLSAAIASINYQCFLNSNFITMSTYTPLVSIVVPVYNVERFLRQCLDSLIEQTYQNLQIILVNDGSTDRSGAICDEYAAQDKRVQVLHKPNGGLSSARNYGLNYVQGDLLAYVDSDDWVNADLYRRVVEKFGATPNLDVVYIDYMFAQKEDSYPKHVHLPPQQHTEKQTITIIEAFARDTIAPSVWNKVYRFELIQDLRFVEGLNYEDIDYTFFASCRVRNYALLDDTHQFIGYYYNQMNEASIMNTLKADVEHAFINLFRIVEQLSQTDSKLIPYIGTKARRQLDAVLAHWKIQPEALKSVIPYIKKVIALPALPETKAKSLRYKFMSLFPKLSVKFIRLWVKYR